MCTFNPSIHFFQPIYTGKTYSRPSPLPPPPTDIFFIIRDELFLKIKPLYNQYITKARRRIRFYAMSDQRL